MSLVIEDVHVHLQGGFLPNVFKVLAHRPAEFRAFFSYYNALMNKESGMTIFIHALWSLVVFVLLLIHIYTAYAIFKIVLN